MARSSLDLGERRVAPRWCGRPLRSFWPRFAGRTPHRRRRRPGRSPGSSTSRASSNEGTRCFLLQAVRPLLPFDLRERLLEQGVVYRTVESDNLPDGRQRRSEAEEVAESGLDRRTPGREAGLPHRRHRVPRAGRARTTPRRLPRDDGRAPGPVPDGRLVRGARPLPDPEALVRQRSASPWARTTRSSACSTSGWRWSTGTSPAGRPTCPAPSTS